MEMLEQEYLKSILHYEPLTGKFTWLININNNGATIGKRAGSIDYHGYIKTKIHGKEYKAHRLAFLYMTGEIPKEIDHIDGNPANNIWINLRAVTHQENTCNRKKSSNNTSGYKGVFFDKRRQRFRARIRYNGKAIDLGRFKTALEAHKAYCEASIKYHKEFGRFK